jgi:hypothetical protein
MHELIHKSKYGDISAHCWMDEVHLMLAFTNGYLVVLSADMQTIGVEIFNSIVFENTPIHDISYSPTIKCCACAGEGGVKVIDFSNGFEQARHEAPTEIMGVQSIVGAADGSLERCTKTGWSPDGQILTVGVEDETSHRIYSCWVNLETKSAVVKQYHGDDSNDFVE